MRQSWGFIVAAALVVAGAANAAPVQKTVRETLSIEILDVGTLAITGAGTVTVDTVVGTLVMPDQIVSLTTSVFIPVTTTTAVKSLTAKPGLGKAAGTWSIGRVTSTTPAEICPATIGLGTACVDGGGLGGGVQLIGTVSVNLGAIKLPIKLGAAGVGSGGAYTTPDGAFKFENAPWTTGTGRVGVTSTTTQTVFLFGSTLMATNTFTVIATTMGTGSLTDLAGTGQLTLVSPTFVDALNGTALLPVFVKNTFEVVPEPGAILFVASGVGGLALLGRRRRR